MKTILLALRNLSRAKKRTFLLGGAIAFGIVVVTLLNGFSASFIENVSENVSHLVAGHIFIEGNEKLPGGDSIQRISDDTQILSVIEDLGLPVRFYTKRTEFDGTLMFAGNSVPMAIVGADWRSESYLTDRLVLVDGSFENMSDRRGIILPEAVAEQLNAQVGDVILIRMRNVTGQQNVGEFSLAAVSHDPGMFGSLKAYANLDYVNELSGLGPGEYQTLGLFLPDINTIDAEADRLFAALRERDISLFERESDENADRGAIMSMIQTQEEEEWSGIRYKLYTLNDMLAEVQQMVDVLNGATIVILLVLFLIIMVGITNTFRMIIFERTREIGTMRALGMQATGVRNLFMLEASFLGVGGVLLGLAVAGLTMFILTFVFWGYDTPFYMFMRNGYLTFRVLADRVLLNFGIVLVLTLIAAYFPTRKGVRMKPVDALRHSG